MVIPRKGSGVDLPGEMILERKQRRRRCGYRVPSVDGRRVNDATSREVRHGQPASVESHGGTRAQRTTQVAPTTTVRRGTWRHDEQPLQRRSQRR